MAISESQKLLFPSPCRRLSNFHYNYVFLVHGCVLTVSRIIAFSVSLSKFIAISGPPNQVFFIPASVFAISTRIAFSVPLATFWQFHEKLSFPCPCQRFGKFQAHRRARVRRTIPRTSYNYFTPRLNVAIAVSTGLFMRGSALRLSP